MKKKINFLHLFSRKTKKQNKEHIENPGQQPSQRQTKNIHTENGS